jgi:DNA-binding IclR family transcriptional regulator
MTSQPMTEQSIDASQPELEHASSIRGLRAGAGVIESAFELLECLRIMGRARVCDLTEESGWPRTTVYRLLCQLAAVGAVERVGTHYRLGANLLTLGEHVTPIKQLRALAQRPMIELAATTSVHVNLCTTANDVSVYLDIYPGPDRLPFRQIPGEPLPASSACARVLSDHVDFAIDDGCTIEGISCAAQAIPLRNGQRAAVGIVVARRQLPRALIGPMRATAHRITVLLAAQSPSRDCLNRHGLQSSQ